MKSLLSNLRKNSNPEKAKILQRFFKTGKGQYGEGDIFLGLTIPQQREIAHASEKRISLDDVQKLLESKIHEERMVGALILVRKYSKSDDKSKKEIFKFYLKNAKRFNNWDLVDLSSPNIVGDFLLNQKDRKILFKLAKSKNLWEKRISIVSTYALIRKNQFDETLKLSKQLLDDKHDLIHKAVGWMLREVGKRDASVLRKFLKENYNNLPRTTLRYAIEKFSESERKDWLKGFLFLLRKKNKIILGATGHKS